MLKLSCFLICFVGYNTAAYVDTLPKCSLKDEDCLKNLYQNIVQGIGSNGISELGIPAVDPIDLEDVTVTVLGLLNITMVKGTATGISGCVFKSFKVDLEKGFGSQDNVCSIVIQGLYNITPSIIIKSILDVHGNGNGKVSINNLHLKFNFPAFAQKRDDGETYIKVDYKNIKYDYEIEGNTEFAADSVYLGGQETSKSIISFLNENHMFVMKTFGKAFIDKAMEFYFGFAGKFFDVVPTKYYITDDLSPIAKP